MSITISFSSLGKGESEALLDLHRREERMESRVTSSFYDCEV